MSATSTLYDVQFKASVRELARIAGKDYSELLHNQAGAVIKALARDQAAKPPSVREIRAAVTRLAQQVLNTPHGQIRHYRDGRIIWRRNSSSPWRLVFDRGPSKGWHLSPAEWGEYRAAVKYRQKWIVAKTRERSARRGLLRMSFIQIADDLRIDLNQVSGASFNQSIPRRAKMPGKLGHAHKAAKGQSYEMILSNFSSGVRGTNTRPYFRTYWQGRLQHHITKRAQAIRIDMRKGVFEDMQLRAKKYPGVFVEP